MEETPLKQLDLCQMDSEGNKKHIHKPWPSRVMHAPNFISDQFELLGPIFDLMQFKECKKLPDATSLAFFLNSGDTDDWRALLNMHDRV